MTIRKLKFATLFLLIGNFSSEQVISQPLYTSVDVFARKATKFDAFSDDEFCRLDSSKFQEDYIEKGLSAIISDSIAKSDYYNKNVLIGYFINNSNDTLIIDRCDRAIFRTETQIFIDNKWTTFQLNLPSDCGLSYFTTKLPPKSFYVLRIPDPSSVTGEIEVKFRVVFTHLNRVFYTNSVIAKLTHERIARTKQKINPQLWDW